MCVCVRLCVRVCVKFVKKVYLSSLWVLVHTCQVSSTLQLKKEYVKIYTHCCTPDEPKRYKNIEMPQLYTIQPDYLKPIIWNIYVFEHLLLYLWD